MGEEAMTARPILAAKSIVGALLRKTLIHNNTQTDQKLTKLEQELVASYRVAPEKIPLVFILASPRTGSTLLYQLMIKYFDLHYFSNCVTENFANYPVIGTLFEIGLIGMHNAPTITLENRYGTTAGSHEPNEATRVLQNWFEWCHPTETCSAQVKTGQRENMIGTLGSITKTTGKPLVIKNAWNCFRIKDLSDMFPAAHFVWLKRDIVASSYSTLLARCTQGDPARIWNSASPANYAEIRGLPYIEQVVEQQYWTNRAVEDGLERYVSEARVTEVWFEELLDNPASVLQHVADRMECVNTGILGRRLTEQPIKLNAPSAKSNDDANFTAVRAYAARHYPQLIRSSRI
jgi:hypothetical protein